MNDREFRYKTDPYILGKEFIIVIVVIFSALSFTLGFFVGKRGRGAHEASAPMTAENPLSVKEKRILATDPVPLEDTVTPGTETTEQDSRQEVVFPGEAENLRSGSEKGNKDALPAQPVSRQSALQEKESALSESRKTPATGHIGSGQSLSGNIIYTVQLAAFKNGAEANNFKETYDRKGYKTFITVSLNQKNEKIHKIRTGEFKNRKDAEILSLKLKKTEGLNTFVTFKNK